MTELLESINVTRFPGVGPKIAERLENIGIRTAQDILFHLPLRYEDRTRIYPIHDVRPGDRVLVEAYIESAVITGRRANLMCRISDDTGVLTLRFFHFTADQKKRLAEAGTKIRCFGEVRQGYRGGLEMAHPEYRLLEKVDSLPVSDTLTPIYPTTKGLHQATLRKLSEHALNLLNEKQSELELLPKQLLNQYQLSDLVSAINYVHRPPPDASVNTLQEGVHPSQQRLAFEELMAHQLVLQHMRAKTRNEKAVAIKTSGKLIEKLLSLLPFDLTQAQQRVVKEIQQDLTQDYPMLRLLQGDVGSGKTIVSAIAAITVVEAGYQVAIMAPTEILAEQHIENFMRWCEPLNVKIVALLGKHTAKVKRAALQEIASGEARIIIGTHALFQNDVIYKNLIFMIIDEQHRFGVQQRLSLQAKGYSNFVPHQLTMTATPIPRTLAMTVYADLDCSIIDELPPGRKPITTLLISNQRRDEVIERVKANCCQQRQVY